MSMPSGSITDGFQISGTKLTWKNGFTACGSGDDCVWQIFANMGNVTEKLAVGFICEPVEAHIVDGQAVGAWEYI